MGYEECSKTQSLRAAPVLQVDFHDTSKHRGVPLFSDYYGITLAALGDRGALYAAPANASGDAVPALVLYRPFEQWAANSDWSAPLPAGEEVVAIAAGEATAPRLYYIIRWQLLVVGNGNQSPTCSRDHWGLYRLDCGRNRHLTFKSFAPQALPSPPSPPARSCCAFSPWPAPKPLSWRCAGRL